MGRETDPPAQDFARAISKRKQKGTVLFHAFPSHRGDAKPSFYGFRQHTDNGARPDRRDGEAA